MSVLPADHMHHHDHDDHGRHHAGHAGHAGHSGHAGHTGHGAHVALFRRRFWLSLWLTVPLVITSHMVMGWFNYTIDFAGISWVGPVLGSVVFWWAGWPF